MKNPYPQYVDDGCGRSVKNGAWLDWEAGYATGILDSEVLMGVLHIFEGEGCRCSETGGECGNPRHGAWIELPNRSKKDLGSLPCAVYRVILIPVGETERRQRKKAESPDGAPHRTQGGGCPVPLPK